MGKPVIDKETRDKIDFVLWAVRPGFEFEALDLSQVGPAYWQEIACIAQQIYAHKNNYFTGSGA